MGQRLKDGRDSYFSLTERIEDTPEGESIIPSEDLWKKKSKKPPKHSHASPFKSVFQELNRKLMYTIITLNYSISWSDYLKANIFNRIRIETSI